MKPVSLKGSDIEKTKVFGSLVKHTHKLTASVCASL